MVYNSTTTLNTLTLSSRLSPISITIKNTTLSITILSVIVQFNIVIMISVLFLYSCWIISFQMLTFWATFLWFFNIFSLIRSFKALFVVGFKSGLLQMFCCLDIITYVFEVMNHKSSSTMAMFVCDITLQYCLPYIVK